MTGWIPCRKAMPKEGAKVIVSVDLIGGRGWNSGVNRIYVCRYDRLEYTRTGKSMTDIEFSEPWFYFVGRDVKPLDRKRVKPVAWMPCPEPYEEEAT